MMSIFSNYARGAIKAISWRAKRFKLLCRQFYINWRAPQFFNKRSASSSRRILLARAKNTGYFYEGLLDWIPDNLPEAVKWIELHPLPCKDVDWSRIGAFHAWLQDPVRERSPATYEVVREVEERCRRGGIPVVNPVHALSNSVRSRMLSLIAEPAIRVPRLVQIDDWEAFVEDLGGLALPIIVRPAWGHGENMYLIRDRHELTDKVRFAISKPIGLEFIDVKDDDGMYRKFRYVMIGSKGIPYHILASSDWNTRVRTYVDTPAIRAQERAYLQMPDPYHARLDAARQRLGFDIVAFDYGLDRNGALVVWEANPFPDLPYPKTPLLPYKRAMADRVFRTLMEFYLERAGIQFR